MNYTEAGKLLGISKHTVRLWSDRMGLGSYIVGPDGRSRRILTDAEVERIRSREDGRKTRWSKAAQDG